MAEAHVYGDRSVNLLMTQQEAKVLETILGRFSDEVGSGDISDNLFAALADAGVPYWDTGYTVDVIHHPKFAGTVDEFQLIVRVKGNDE